MADVRSQPILQTKPGSVVVVPWIPGIKPGMLVRKINQESEQTLQVHP
jgi:hypothetical protein